MLGGVWGDGEDMGGLVGIINSHRILLSDGVDFLFFEIREDFGEMIAP